MAARIVGAAPIIAVDIRPARLKLARALGATHAIDPRKTNLARRARAITGGGLDYIVEGTGDARLSRLGRELLNPGGRLALLTGGSGEDLAGGRKIISVIQGDAVAQRFIPYLIRLWRAGRFPFDRLLRFYDFADINRAIADERRGRAIKAVVRMSA